MNDTIVKTENGFYVIPENMSLAGKEHLYILNNSIALRATADKDCIDCLGTGISNKPKPTMFRVLCGCTKNTLEL